jgi:ERCC4-related helicase
MMNTENKAVQKFHERLRARYLLERLMLKRNPLDYRAYVETFRESLIDANPHQVEAIVFALEKLENGGCILADEVGLGKTIEAGLVISQYHAQRRFNILIIVPTSLAGQWNSELRKLFHISSRIVTSADKRKLKKDEPELLFEQDSVYILGREFASRLERTRVLSKKPWDLIVVDEAHELFANIYRRFTGRSGQYNEDSKESTMAASLFRLFKRTPLLLLTATPIQNNILELWGLSSYILPQANKSHLGQFNHFKELFVHNGEIIEEKIPELKERISNFLVRNLRMYAQEFMTYKFTKRNCETLNFNMDDKEKAIYDRISAYLERDDIYAYSTKGMIDLKDDRAGGIRKLLKMSYRRALGSSFPALGRSLQGILERLNKMKAGEWVKITAASATDDWENDEEDRGNFDVPDEEEIRIPFTPGPEDIEAIEAEILEVEDFIQKAHEIQKTGKDKLLVKWLKEIFADTGRFSQKAVIFTTYTATQQHLLEILEENGFKDQAVLFSGSGSRTQKAKEDIQQAVETWKTEIGPTISPTEQPTGDILVRTALVYYFKTRKQIFISTEAGAKGLNLQFCNVIINYDLPWNPQRIEQRIGRCHRYGQERDVLVINCINADNETEQRIYNILSNKFQLFKSLLGAGDDILGTLSKAYNFEFRVNEILNRCKTREERLIWLQKLEEEIDEQTRQIRDEKLQKVRSLLDELDPQVRMKLKNIKEKLPESFSRYDADMLELLRCYAQGRDIPFRELKQEGEQVYLQMDGRSYCIGKRDEENPQEFQHIDLKHPLLERIKQDIMADNLAAESTVTIDYTHSDTAGEILKPYVGRTGHWDFYRVRFKGFEEEERLYDIVSVDDDGSDGNDRGRHFLLPVEVTALKESRVNPCADDIAGRTSDADMTCCVEEKIKQDRYQLQELQQPRIDKKIHNLEVELKDMEEYLEKEEQEILDDLAELDKKINITFDREAGKKLLEQKRKRQKDLTRCRKDLLEFQNNFQEMFDEEELKLMEKRFIETSTERIFSLRFIIQ